ncbi:hypothetical protein M409DRAFT_29653 [Zasmidium cellare ATCC 36951]|uniref:Uncharacterized protein n=1 Tax=Zasmidium cellare ATCC 36951 TaxID=1080233 RepID=A0A6A6BZ15_ZASCE|nr:uncharacterized protein M409DRAFT_29653 [Zasmidium cellare ATCC 36951]KAF2159843.1 hypothetical protein M409DRAFT_29653 [Zasmidium cellare ATCC 36951]
MPYNYTTAKDALTDAEKARIICIFLNMDQSVVMQNTNWETAKTQMASASIESMKKGLTNTLKKLDKVENGTDTAPTPTKKTPAKKTPSKKRKTTAGGSVAGVATEKNAESDDDQEQGSTKKVKTEGDDDDEEEEEEEEGEQYV